MPNLKITNGDLSKEYPEYSEDKIFKATGIYNRYVVSNESTVDLAYQSSLKLIHEYNIDKNDIDFILLCTQTADFKLPSSACILQDKLGIKKTCGCLDYDLGCSGFVYGLMLAKSLIKTMNLKNLLLVTSDTRTKLIHKKYKPSRLLSSDGSAAILITSKDCDNILNFDYGTDGSGWNQLIVYNGGSKNPYDFYAEEIQDEYGNITDKNHTYMNGGEILKFAIHQSLKSIPNTLSINNMEMKDIDLFVFHQPSKIILDSIRKLNKIPKDKFYINIDKHGNTSSSTIPIALKDAIDEQKIKENMNIMVFGFGVGLSWCSTIIKWR